MEKAKSNTLIACAVLASSSLSYAGESPLSLSASLGLEYDDNITVSALDTATGQSDEAVVLDFSASYLALESENAELELVYDLYQSKHDSLSDFDLQIHTLSAFGSWEINEKDLGLYYSYSTVDLGSDDLYNSHSLTPSVAFAAADNWYNQISYSLVLKNFDSASERDATQNSISTDNYYFFMDSTAYTSIGAKLEKENADDNELDYQALYLKAAISIPVSYEGEQIAKFKGKYQRYWRDYDNITDSIGEKREDDQDLIGLTLIKPIDDRFDVVLNYEYTNTRSNLSSVDAEGNVITLSVAADF